MADAASQVLLGSGLTILSQPLMYVKVLIQVGYEPLPPTIGRNIFGRQVCQLPGLFCYAQHIASIDGKRGLFTGLTPRLCSGVLGTVVHGKVLQKKKPSPLLLGLETVRHKRKSEHYQECDKAEESGSGNVQKEVSSSFDRVIKETTREMMARSAATLITHPFHVITLRSMVQFIGRESKYCGLCDSIATIYREEGILGFFAGLIPRLLGDIISLWLCNSLAYLVNTYALDSGVSTMNEMKSYSQAVTGACWRMPSLLPSIFFLDRLLVHATKRGKYEPRK
ncbi:mitochondrial carrier homolog 2 isoform X5 [Hippopotamus amphibius kiboko]|uniref:mitochondrial carrier homolog 2 isoform X5 n=1 Tax=Hippopotamus amphibius kiboko TaxID=575201 RepID=UPI0025984202|nr:mitochondrial carrier homolog 2 isoform X5 [Hippopotamus amphibius kiboko]